MSITLELSEHGGLVMIAPHNDGKGTRTHLPAGHELDIIRSTLLAQAVMEGRKFTATAACPTNQQARNPAKLVAAAPRIDNIYVDPTDTGWAVLILMRKTKSHPGGQSAKFFKDQASAETFARTLGWTGNAGGE